MSVNSVARSRPSSVRIYRFWGVGLGSHSWPCGGHTALPEGHSAPYVLVAPGRGGRTQRPDAFTVPHAWLPRATQTQTNEA